jgi:hypothetical protein
MHTNDYIQMLHSQDTESLDELVANLQEEASYVHSMFWRIPTIVDRDEGSGGAARTSPPDSS